jgi:DNA-binding response OmpR family regulator
MMPELNGFDICQAVKQDEALKHIFMVILTAKGQELDRQRGEQAGADVFMTKPFDPDELIGLASSVLE